MPDNAVFYVVHFLFLFVGWKTLFSMFYVKEVGVLSSVQKATVQSSINSDIDEKVVSIIDRVQGIEVSVKKILFK